MVDCMFRLIPDNQIWNRLFGNRLERFAYQQVCGFLLIVCGMMLCGCGKTESQSVVLFSASSMSDVLQEVERGYELDHPEEIELISAGSQTLAMQIREGARADIFVSADLEQIQRVDGFSEPVVLVENQLIGVVPHGSQFGTIRGALADADRIIIAHKDVPAGRYTQRALEQIGLWEEIQSRVVSQEHSVRGVLTKVVMGEGDLGFVYSTDALKETDSVRSILFADENTTNTKTWISINLDLDADSPASAVYRSLMESAAIHEVFVRHGFSMPGGDR
jgi:molybdate transport system substrate-binding protein